MTSGGAHNFYSYRMECLRVPILDTNTSILSPSLSGLHVSSAPVQPTPPGVPVMMTVPRRSVVPWERNEMSEGVCTRQGG